MSLLCRPASTILCKTHRGKNDKKMRKESVGEKSLVAPSIMSLLNTRAIRLCEAPIRVGEGKKERKKERKKEPFKTTAD